MKKQMFTAAALAAAVATSSASAATVFSEDWDDGAGAGRWTTVSFQEDAGIAFDGTVDHAFDYSTIGAPSATSSVGGTTLGVAMETNTTDQCPGGVGCAGSDEGEAMGIVADAFSLPAGDYTFTADMYMFWNGGGGSTEYAGIGAHVDTASGAPLRFGLNQPAGIHWQVDSDGDSGTDILRYTPGVETGLGGYEDIPDGSIPGVVTGPSKVGPFNQWVELKIISSGGIVTFSMNDFVIDTFDNTGGTFSGGSIMLNASDPFNSVNLDDLFGFSNLQVFDNVVVTDVPEPASLALLGLGGLAMLRRK